MQVRAGSPASRTYFADEFALAQSLATLNVNSAQVRVNTGAIVTMPHKNNIAEALQSFPIQV